MELRLLAYRTFRFALSKAPREHGVKVVLTGEGADEHFAGYPLLFPDYLAERDHSWPAYNILEREREKLWTAGKQASAGFFDVKHLAMNSGQFHPTVAGRQLNNVTTLQAIGGNTSVLFSPWVSEYGDYDQQLTISNNVDGRVRDDMVDKWHPLHTGLYIWIKGYLANIILTALGDRMEMAHSLEARPPFLDHHLTEYVNHLPPSVKVRWDPSQRSCIEKWILREAAKPFVTNEIYKRKKHPYTAPSLYPPNGPLHMLFSKLLSKENIDRIGFIEWKVVENIIPAAFEQQDTASFRTAILLAQRVVLSQKFDVRTAVPSMLPAASSDGCTDHCQAVLQARGMSIRGL
jgi:asparagine synthase (glutamine-hydrolysing)